MIRRLALLLILAALSIPCTARSLWAQDASIQQEASVEDDAPAHVAYVEGSVTLERDGRAETSPLNMPLLSGDRVKTSEGRAEILFGDGSTLFVDAGTTVDLQSDDLLRLIDGRVRINIPGPPREVSYRIDSPAGSARITQPGDYRVSLLRGDRDVQVELAVIRGAGEIFTDQGSTPVRAGQRAYASAGLLPSYAYAYNSAAWDDFDRWTEARRDIRSGVSAQYLPSEVQSYAPVLDESGDWRYAEPYGYVWYPRVAASWRPYYYGRWMSYPRYGWTWVGLDRFGWPTHHYGRWGFSAGAWFWIPGSHWSPAWVSWAYAPGYVSWCPLGYDNRALFGINVNIGSRYYSPWTVVAAPHFGYGYVQQRVIYVDRVFDQRSRPVFVARSGAPAYRDVAVPRGSAPIRWAGSHRLASDGVVRPRLGTPNPARGATGDNYFTREDVRRDHAVERGASPSMPQGSPRGSANPNRGTAPARDVPVRRNDVGPAVSSPRAVPRGPVSESPATAPRAPAAPIRPSADGGVRRTAPDTAIRRADPNSYGVRERVNRDVRPPASSAPAASPVQRQPTTVPRAYGETAPREYARPSAAPREMSPAREYARPSPAPRETPQPREYARPIAAPREAAPSREMAVPRNEPRAAEPRAEAPSSRPAPDRAAPRATARPSGGHR